MIRFDYKFQLLFFCRIVIFLFSESIYAQSSPPLLLNDPGTPGTGKWEINIMTSLEHSTVNDQWQILLLDVNYGLGEHIQLTAALPYVVDWNKGTKEWLGFDGVEFGIKYRFLDKFEFLTSDLSINPKVYSPFKTEEGSEFILPLEWHRTWSNIGLTAEIGHVWVKGEASRWEGGVGVGISFERVQIFGEWHTSTWKAPFNIGEPMVNVGMSWKWSENVSLYFSIGKSLFYHIDETNFWSLGGIQFLL
jgi:hypothetical protein